MKTLNLPVDIRWGGGGIRFWKDTCKHCHCKVFVNTDGDGRVYDFDFDGTIHLCSGMIDKLEFPWL